MHHRLLDDYDMHSPARSTPTWQTLNFMRENAEKPERLPTTAVFATVAFILSGALLSGFLIADYVQTIRIDSGWVPASESVVRAQCVCRYGCMVTAMGACNLRLNLARQFLAFNQSTTMRVCAGAEEQMVWSSNVTVFLQGGLLRRIDGYCVPANQTYVNAGFVVGAQGALLIGHLTDVDGGRDLVIPSFLASSTTAAERLLVNRVTTINGRVTTQLHSEQRTILAVDYCLQLAPPDPILFSRACVAVNLYPVESKTVESRSGSLIALVSLLGGLINGVLLTFFRLAMRVARRCNRCCSKPQPPTLNTDIDIVMQSI